VKIRSALYLRTIKKSKNMENLKDTAETINNQLDCLYAPIWGDLKSDIDELNSNSGISENRASLPLFLQLGDDYDNASLRILYYGQEERPVGALKKTKTRCELYEYYKINNEKKNKESKAQGNAGRMVTFLKKLFKEEKYVYTIHNNIVRIPSCKDKGGNYGKATKSIEDICKKYFKPLAIKEIVTIQPDAIFIFAKSYYNKNLVKDYIGTFKKAKDFKEKNDKLISKMTIKDKDKFWSNLIVGYFEEVPNIPVIVASQPSHGWLERNTGKYL
jgi:hypothetical protein